MEQWLGILVMQGQWQVFSFCTFTVIHLMLAPFFSPMFIPVPSNALGLGPDCAAATVPSSSRAIACTAGTHQILRLHAFPTQVKRWKWLMALRRRRPRWRMGLQVWEVWEVWRMVLAKRPAAGQRYMYR